MAEQVLLNNELLLPLEDMPASCFEDTSRDDFCSELLDEQNAQDPGVEDQNGENMEQGEGVLGIESEGNHEGEEQNHLIEEEMQIQEDEVPVAEGPKEDQGVQQAAESATRPVEEGYVFKCIFCDMTLTSKDRPKILECLHNACGSCIDQKVLEIQDPQQDIKEIYCRICGCYMDPKNIIDNQFLTDDSTDDSNKFDNVKCSNCGDGMLASSWCVDCSEFICDTCVQAHQRLKITKDHTIKHKDEGLHEQASGTSGETPLFCSMHPHERLSLFCENCEKLTCRDCQLTEHRDHKYKFTHEIAEDCRKSLNSMLTDISYKRILLTSAMKVIDDRQGLINDKKQTLVQQITQLVVKLTNTINQRGKQLVSRLNEISESKHKTLDEKKVALDHLSQMTDHCILFTRNVLDFANDNALLYSKRHLASHLQRIKLRRADIPNPEIPVRIDLALEKVSDLIKVIGGIGQIIVDGRVYPSSQSPAITTPQSSPSPNTGLLPVQGPSGVPHIAHPQAPQPPPNTSQPQQPMNNMYMQPQQPQRMMGPYSMQQYPNHPNVSNTPPMLQQHNMGPMKHQNIPNPIQNLSQTVQNLNTAKMQQQQQQGTMQGGSAMNALSRMSHNQHRHRMPHMSQQMPPMRQPSMPQQSSRMQPPMNQQVSSSTHPQTNLRTLLQPHGNNTVYIQTGPNQYQAVTPQYVQQYQSRHGLAPPYRPQQPPSAQGGPQPPPQSSQNQGSRYPYPPQRPPHYGNHGPTPPRPGFQQLPGGKWHHPQSGQQDFGMGPSKSVPTPTLNSNYKIMLKPQNMAQASVTSTNPKTPSPNYLHNDTNPEKSLDKFCEESVNDLMATIAKLDSNGVQVLAENRPKGNSPHVDSSTGDVGGKKINDAVDKDDPNEDWCAVCMDGGELVCCDKCPKVFHQLCHIPNLSIEESETWQCLLCFNFADIPDNAERIENDLTQRQRKLAERIILELYCQYELSLPFREIIGAENTAYHEVIKSPIALDTIRQKLDWNWNDRYKSLEELVRDVRLMFKNARLYNAVDSQVYSDATNLEKFFDEQLEKWLPEYAYEMFEEDDDAPPHKRFRRIVNAEN